jgi:hypothetical protein
MRRLRVRDQENVMAKSTTPRVTTTRKPRAARADVLPPPRLVPRTTPTPEAIAARAYELFLDNGATHGYDVEHWLQAERELTDRLLTSAA